ncbi:MAG TPA: hypothetical protein VM389_14195 [Phycisphaerae bacterium]|nr:hypothetical protein [Phycisphaerae bacterium]
MMEVLEQPEALEGVTRPGFTWRHTGWHGAERTCTVRDLAGRRIRVEIKMTLIRDPLLPLLGVCY